MNAKALIVEAEEYNKDQLLSLLRGPGLWIGLIFDDGGHHFYASRTMEGLYRQFAQYCRDNWAGMGARNLPPDTGDRALVHWYFAHLSDTEWLEVKQFSVPKSDNGKVWVALLQDPHDHRLRVADTDTNLYKQLAEWCRQGWSDVAHQGEAPPEDAANLISIYLTRQEGNETWDIEEIRSMTKAKALIEADDLSKEELLRLTRPPNIWIEVVFSHEGHDIFASRTKHGLYRQLAEYCRDFWGNVGGTAPDISDRELVNRYFEEMSGERWTETVPVPLSAAEQAGSTVCVAIFHHRHGHDLMAAGSEAGVYAKVADFCREWWPEVAHEDEAPPEDTQELLNTYLERQQGNESLSIEKVVLYD